MIIHDCAQGSPEWFAVRAGIPTASEFATVMASGKDGGASKTRRTYLLKLAGEVITGECTEPYTNPNMERGKVMEAAAREMYAFRTDTDPQLVGFITNGPMGASPDCLIEASGAAEFKTAFPHILIEKILRDTFPPEHKAQTQGVLLVAEREWIDLGIYWPKLPLFLKRAYRDEPYIREMSAAIRQFNDELAETVERVRAYIAPTADAA